MPVLADRSPTAEFYGAGDADSDTEGEADADSDSEAEGDGEADSDADADGDATGNDGSGTGVGSGMNRDGIPAMERTITRTKMARTARIHGRASRSSRAGSEPR